LKIKEGAKPKKLALGDSTIVGDEIVERTDDMKTVSKIRETVITVAQARSSETRR
jgi:hypothetical protein